MLADIKSPADLRGLSTAQLDELAAEIRQFLIEHISRSGGHLSPNLGVVELTLALHRVFDSPKDSLVWDTGHQSYVHKLVTGRREGFAKLRQPDGLSGYPSRRESEHDLVENSHASTSLSYGLGLAEARLPRAAARVSHGARGRRARLLLAERPSGRWRAPPDPGPAAVPRPAGQQGRLRALEGGDFRPPQVAPRRGRPLGPGRLPLQGVAEAARAADDGLREPGPEVRGTGRRTRREGDGKGAPAGQAARRAGRHPRCDREGPRLRPGDRGRDRQAPRCLGLRPRDRAGGAQGADLHRRLRRSSHERRDTSPGGRRPDPARQPRRVRGARVALPRAPARLLPPHGLLARGRR